MKEARINEKLAIIQSKPATKPTPPLGVATPSHLSSSSLSSSMG